jgi:hypothetical protein
MRALRRARTLALVAGLLGVLAVAGSSPVSADYGNAKGNVQLYQVTASSNCNNPSLCGPQLGGFWAWAVFNANGTFDGEVTGCGHLANDHLAGAQSTGAQHFHVEGHYIITDFGLGPWLVIVDEVDTATGGSAGTGTVIPVPSEFVPIGPAAKAKLTAIDVFGFTGPGVSFNVTVTPMHTA